MNQKLTVNVADLTREKADEQSLWEMKEKEMKVLLNSYYIEKKKLESDLEEKDN